MAVQQGSYSGNETGARTTPAFPVSRFLLLEQFFRLLDYVFRSKPELLVEVLNRSGCAEVRTRNHAPFIANVLAPSKIGSGFDGHACFYLWREHAFAVLLRLLLEELPRGHTDHSTANSFGGQLLMRCHGELQF